MNINIDTNIIPSYRDIFFKELSIINNEIKLKVYICARNEKNRNWGLKKNKFYNYELLRGIKINFFEEDKHQNFKYFSTNLIGKFIFSKPDFLIIGDAGLNTYLCIFLSKILMINNLLWLEDSRNIKEIPFAIRIIKKIMYKLCNKFVVPSYKSKKLLLDFGIKRKNISIIKNAVNNNEFRGFYKKNIISRNKIRKKIGLNNKKFCFVIVAQLIPRKRIIETITLLNKLTCEINIELIIVGEGYLLSETIKLLNNSKISYKIYSNLNNKELSTIYTAADCLLLFSKSEPWGMVINEALLHNLPCLTTNSVMAAQMFKEEFPIVSTKNFRKIDESYLLKKIKEIKLLKNEIEYKEPYSPKEMAKDFFKLIKTKSEKK